MTVASRWQGDKQGTNLGITKLGSGIDAVLLTPHVCGVERACGFDGVV